LDLGCGNGYVLEQIIAPGRNLTGMDISSFMVNVTKKRLKKNSELIVGDAVFLPFKEGCFDYVYSIRTLINVVSKEKQELAIKEAIRVLKAEGLFLLLECSMEGIKNLNKIRRLFGIDELRTHTWWGHLFFEREMLEAALKRNHVRILENTYFPIITLLEDVFYPKVKHIRGARRLLSLLYSLVYYVDRRLCKLFPVIGFEILYVGRKERGG
jgi:ubiquinone/menaquinone biosynthesis C-methylase UbiE